MNRLKLLIIVNIFSLIFFFGSDIIVWLDRNWNTPVVATATGSIITLVGVITSNYYSDRRQQRELQARKELEYEQREFELKKNIYLEAVENVSKMMSYLGRLSQKDLSQDEELQELSSKLTKVSLIAERQATVAMHELMKKFFQEFPEIILLKVHLEMLKSGEAASQDIFHEYLSKVKYFSDKIDKGGILDDVSWNSYNNLVDKMSIRCDEFSDKSTQVQKISLKLTKKCTYLNSELLTHFDEFIIEARKELEIGISWEEEYRKLCDDAHQVYIQSMENMLSQADEIIDE